MVRSGTKRLAVAVAALVLGACGGDMDDPPSTCGAPGRAGMTECSVTTCNAGQYCDDSGFPTCTPGCTSDQNCGPNEFCARAAGEPIGACQSCPVCGNGSCERGESAASCDRDCASAAACGNGRCESGESAASCASDCAAAQCGNTVCEPGESAANCPPDCGVGSVCGNGRCEGGESAANCVVDCGGAVCGNGRCEGGESAANCVPDCGGSVCGNGRCDAGESAANCAPDCGGPACGNGRCELGESAASCAVDCRDDSLTECLDNCDSYNFFDCFEPGGLQSCRDRCNGATMAQREQFNQCGGTGAVSCDGSCFRFL